MNLLSMDDADVDRILFMTPSLTPHISDSNTSDYFDLECSFSQKEYQQQMSHLTTELQKVANLSCQSSENESDIQDQQPTEATDDSNDSSHIQITTVNHTIDDSLHLQASEEQDTHTLSVVQETGLIEESFSSVTSDTETILMDECLERPVFNYSRSLCVAYKDEDDDISIIKEALTDKTPISLEFTGIEKKDNKNLGHIMISYNHSTRAVCSRISKHLKDRNYIIWIDEDNISGNIFGSMASAVENSFVVLMAINEQYYESRYCRLEAEYSVERNKASIPLLMQAGYKAQGWLGIINGAKLHIDFSQLPFDEAFNLLVREIEAVRSSLGANENDRTVAIPINNQITTTMSSTYFHYHNVQEWSADDVIEWLNREKLQIFENALKNFTGATLWQLYKIKFDSPSDYHRMVDLLISPTMPLRIFYILTFNSAIETLFSSSFQSIHR
ncbi:unnamed protein product [Adineta steineri]|uniref:TIR domain-containing protein n=1 Tax=Adineta steineri TaxID=433720 RepID=A0A813ZT65_9BILA|nr:unnamed protein product [Adineta steineri]CAF3510148.1 unnamed protein product [Adineta steineri]